MTTLAWNHFSSQSSSNDDNSGRSINSHLIDMTVLQPSQRYFSLDVEEVTNEWQARQSGIGLDMPKRAKSSCEELANTKPCRQVQ